MTNHNIEQLAIRQSRRYANGRNRRFRLETFLPKRKAWIQTLILLPFGLPVANFLGASWHFSLNSIVEEHQYLIGTLSMAINLLLPTVFFAFLFHWSWFIWHQAESEWYPQLPALQAGAYATTTIAISFGLVALFTQSLGICGNPTWGAIGTNLLCNLDGYGFEAKSWFGGWFIIAAYCYQAQNSIGLLAERIFTRRKQTSRTELSDFRAIIATPGTSHDEFSTTPAEPIINNTQD